MTTAGTYYYQPSAGTGNLLLANPPFVFDSMDTNQPTTADGLPELTEFHALREKAPRYRDGGVGRELWIAQKAYRMGADAELEACCEWVRDGNGLLNGFQKQADDMRADRRPKPPSLREQALAQLDVLHADLGAHGLGTNTDAIRRALEALPE